MGGGSYWQLGGGHLAKFKLFSIAKIEFLWSLVYNYIVLKDSVNLVSALSYLPFFSVVLSRIISAGTFWSYRQ